MSGKCITAPHDFVERGIRDWPRDISFECDDLVLSVGKGYGDKTRQDIQITVQSAGFFRFLSDNQSDWISGELTLPKIHTRVRPEKKKSAKAELAVATFLMSPDPEATERQGDGASCLSAPYQFSEKLRPIEISHLGEQRLQTYLQTLAETICDPELTLSAFKPGGVVAANLVVWEPILSVIYFALKTGRQPGAVLECLSDFNVSDTREGLSVLVERAHARMSLPR